MRGFSFVVAVLVWFFTDRVWLLHLLGRIADDHMIPPVSLPLCFGLTLCGDKGGGGCFKCGALRGTCDAGGFPFIWFA